MTPEQLAYWLQGFAELHPEPPSAAQWQAIREHVASVFEKVTPPLAEADIRRILQRPLPLDAVRRPRDLLRTRLC